MNYAAALKVSENPDSTTELAFRQHTVHFALLVSSYFGREIMKIVNKMP